MTDRSITPDTPPRQLSSSALPSSFQTPPTHTGSRPLPNSESYYNEFVSVVALKRARGPVSSRALFNLAVGVLTDYVPEERLDDIAKQFAQRYEQGSAQQVAEMEFQRGKLSREAEQMSRRLLEDSALCQNFSPYLKESLRRAFAMSLFGIVHSAFFDQFQSFQQQQEQQQQEQDRLRVPSDPTDYIDPEQVFPPSPIDLSSIKANFPENKTDNEYSNAFFWLLAVRTVHDFVPSQITLPEEQFVAGLWSPLLQSCLRINAQPCLDPTFQLSMARIIGGLSSDRYVDLAFHLKPIPGRDVLKAAFNIPILMAEVSPFEVKSDYDHKDYRKLAACMVGGLVALLGVTRSLPPDDKKKLRMYGMFIGGHQCLPCVMVPVNIDTNTASFVLYCQQDRRFNLLGSDRSDIPDVTSNVEDIEASEVLPELAQSKAATVGDIEKTPEDIQKEKVLSELDQREDATAVALDKRGIRMDTCQDLPVATIAKNLRPLVAFCSMVSKYANMLRDLLSGLDDPKNPYSMWREASTFPKSRPSHERSTPGSQRSSFRLNRSDVDVSIQPVVDADSSMMVIKVKKRSCRKEADMLSAAQGDGIVLLKSFKAPIDTLSDGCILFEEQLDVVDFATLTSTEMGLLLIRLFLDGLAAIETLRSAGIVHRDISPNNLMYSFEAQAWRLTDFDCAEYLVGARSSHVFGTDGFIAPEAIASGEYTHASDLWSLACTIRYFIKGMEDELWSRTGEPDGIDIEDLLLRSQSEYCLSLRHDDPARRMLAPADLEALSADHAYFEKLVAGPHHHGKWIRPRALAPKKRPRLQSSQTVEELSHLDVPIVSTVHYAHHEQLSSFA